MDPKKESWREFNVRKFTEQELQKLREERTLLNEEQLKRAQEVLRALGSATKKVLNDIINNAREILYPREAKLTDRIPKPIQREKVAIFWDYENFALPKSKVADDLFFKMIYPSKRKFEILTKRVFSKKLNISKHLPVLLDEGFEFYETTSERKNATDEILIDNCLQFCSLSQEKVIVILITGDSDYIELIKELVINLNHEVRIIYSSEGAVSQEMKRLVPIVLDLNILFEERKKKLEKKMLNEEDEEKWAKLWEEFKVFEEDNDNQEETLNRLARNAKSTSIRSRAQKYLINFVSKTSNQ